MLFAFALTESLKIGTFEELFGSFDGQRAGRMSEREFQLWKAFNRIYPFTSRAEDHRFGVLASAIKGDGSFPFEHFPGHFWMESDRVELLTERLENIRRQMREKAKREAEREAKKHKPRR